MCYAGKLELSDNGTLFSSPTWRDVLERGSDIRVIFKVIRYSQLNPAKRIRRELGQLFKTLCHDQHSCWAKHVPKVVDLLNIIVHSGTGFISVELHFGT